MAFVTCFLLTSVLRRQKAGGAGSDIYKIIKMIMDRSYQPVIVFAFSKRECEGLGLQLAKLDFNDESEKNDVEQIFQNAMDALSEDDRQLPQIEQILPVRAPLFHFLANLLTRILAAPQAWHRNPPRRPAADSEGGHRAALPGGLDQGLLVYCCLLLPQLTAVSRPCSRPRRSPWA